MITAFSCSNDSNDTIKLIEGTWNCINCNKQSGNDYTEIEISDSIYYFIQENQYFGLIQPYNYEVELDSLLVKNKTGQTIFRFKIDPNKQQLVESNKSIWRKFITELKLSNLDSTTNELYKKEFTDRKNKYR